jgi:hypothetical protein
VPKAAQRISVTISLMTCRPDIGSGLVLAVAIWLALVLELVESGTLADRLKSGPLPVDDALAVARQMGDGHGGLLNYYNRAA